MYAQTKYHREIKTAVMGERTFTIKNLTPILSLPPPSPTQLQIIDACRKSLVLGRLKQKNGEQDMPYDLRRIIRWKKM